jgi:uncharacterized lipoprotein
MNHAKIQVCRSIRNRTARKVIGFFVVGCMAACSRSQAYKKDQEYYQGNQNKLGLR